VRPPRPTIAFLKSLPAETFPDSDQRRQIAQGDWLNLEFYRVSHPLIDDARTSFAEGGVPDLHRTSTGTAGRSVFELRDRQGAAWRGAAVLDDDGDPWIVYAEKHNRFHNRAAEALKRGHRDNYMPTAAEYKLRAREEAVISDRRWRQRLLLELLAAVDGALHAPDGCATAELPNREETRTACEVRVELEHDVPPAELDGLTEASTMVTIVLSFPTKPDRELQTAALQEFVPFLEPQPGSLQSIFGTAGELHIFCTISQAKLVQLIAAANSTEGAATEPTQRQAPVSLHYVGSVHLTEAFVFGKTVRAVCGTWFVPTRDESTDLPVCETCESELPIAQAVVDVILGRVSAQ
jgi:hypothetical protein